MRRRCNGAPTQWIFGIICIAIGLGMLFACLLPKCTVLIGAGWIGLGAWLICKGGKRRR